MDLLTTKQFAQICRVTSRTLRFYDKQGIFSPAFTDPETGYRHYLPQQAKLFLRIKLMQNFHLTLKEIKEAVKEKKIEADLNQQLSNLQEEVTKRQKEFLFLKQIQQFLFEKENIEKFIKIEKFKPRLLFCRSINHADYDKINSCRQRLWQKAKELRIAHADEDMCFYFTNEYRPKDIQVEVAVVCDNQRINRKLQILPKNYYFREFPATTALTYTYAGPYNYFILIYQQLDQYFFSKHFKLAGLVFNVYEKSFFNTNSKYDFRTKLCYPIKQVNSKL